MLYDDDMLTGLKEALGWMADYVKSGTFVAGTSHMTVADLSMLASWSTIVNAGMVDEADFPALADWAERCRTAARSYQKANGDGADKFGALIKGKADGIRAAA